MTLLTHSVIRVETSVQRSTGSVRQSRINFARAQQNRFRNGLVKRLRNSWTIGVLTGNVSMPGLRRAQFFGRVAVLC
jgi:hypothetical protein